jgi:GDPmannose 4,6-dehydratase
MHSVAILGANGQDGSYLCEIEATAGRRVLAIGRQPAYAWEPPAGEFHYHQLDVSDQQALRGFLNEQEPHSIFHVAAVHGAAGFTYEPVVEQLFAVSVTSVHSCLEYLRERGNGQLFYASSAKVFGASLTGNVDESSPRRADCIYSTAKIAASNLIDCYRRDHQISAVVAFLFNHESRRRPPEFFVPTIARALAAGIAGMQTKEAIKTLDFHADWGCAREYMGLVSRAIKNGLNEDLVIATGETVYAADAINELFAAHGLDYRDYLEVAEEAAPGGAAPFHAIVERLAASVGGKPATGFRRLVEDIAGVTA